MNANEIKLYKFYEECSNKGYHNMFDATESLKAKVIATDLGLKYKDIAKLFEEAKSIYDAEIQRKEKEEELQNTPGKQILKFVGTKAHTDMKVYRREDGSFYHTFGNAKTKYEGVPAIRATRGGVIVFSYHPSKTVITGASSGGIAMGGFHNTEAYYTEGTNSTGNGYLEVISGSNVTTIAYIKIDENVLKKFKRVKWVKEHIKDRNIIYCQEEVSEYTKSMQREMVFRQGDIYSKMTMLSVAADSARLPMEECQGIARFINDVLSEKFPPTDEEVYQKALSLETAATSRELQEGINLFKSVTGYKDATIRAKNLKEKYEEVQQQEKEQAILQKEAKQAERKAFIKKLYISFPVVVILLVILVIGLNRWNDKQVQKQKEMELQASYEKACALYEEGKYSNARRIFVEIEGYKDSNEMIIQSHIQQALQSMQDEDYEDAIRHFELSKERETDKDNLAKYTQYIQECEKKWAEAEALAAEEAWREEVNRACKSKDWDWFYDNFNKFEQLTGDKIDQMIVGEWYFTSESGRIYRTDYTEEGEKVSHALENGYQTTTSNYRIEGDCIFEGTSDYAIFGLGNGYYLKWSVYSEREFANPWLMWPVSFGE